MFQKTEFSIARTQLAYRHIHKSRFNIVLIDLLEDLIEENNTRLHRIASEDKYQVVEDRKYRRQMVQSEQELSTQVLIARRVSLTFELCFLVSLEGLYILAL